MTGVESAERTALRGLADRERLADERERLADERERLADERERLADEREKVADELDRLLPRRVNGEFDPAAGRAQGSRQRLRESEIALDHARLALARSQALLERQKVAVGNDDNAARQQELAIAREMFDSRATGGSDPAP